MGSKSPNERRSTVSINRNLMAIFTYSLFSAKMKIFFHLSKKYLFLSQKE
ncbi:hypothetical protein BFO_2327 [Tannerella forsythia 92A2]|uniref:Uncharacterized protein n=1 Tax=Tannerella forsythia (strain ATCC 43037 / JCM 10827 / CCUG 21028 A / KCTC 5666 / FDC 338) TaxID=203275 RepID=G8UK02_TANFA|nr:hypothetical protein BFO_2327 [Tannerella forsythia 92A2]